MQMHMMGLGRRVRIFLLVTGSTVALAACEGQPIDFDLRGLGGGFSTANAATAKTLAPRPKPDNRGVISYPTYQVAVAQRGDTLNDVAARVGASADKLASYNGIARDVPLRKGEIIALPNRVAEPSAATGAGTQPVDISALAGNAIDNAPATPGVQTTALPQAEAPRAGVQPGKEPVRHRVERGETAFTIARLYSVPVKALAEWNGLGSDFKIREGQFLLIPVAQQRAPRAAAATSEPLPGTGSPTPQPPSASKPLPADDTSATPSKPTATPSKPVADVGKTTKPAKTAKMTAPVEGSIIRAYSKGRNEGINIKGAAGASVKAADGGTVAAITKSAEGVPIVVVRHAGNLLTVYANVTDVQVSKGDSVKRGQQIAKLRSGKDSYVHFEVRQGFDSVDPAPFING